MATPTVDNYGNYLAFGGDPQLQDFPPQVAFTLVGSGNPNTLGITTDVFPALFYDEANNVMYGSPDGSTWTAIAGGGGGGTTQVYFGNGAPVSTPTNPAFYYDKDSGDIWAWNGSSWDQLTSH